MKEIQLNVDGMVCEGCEKRVQNAIQTLEGIEKVTADHQKGIVNILASQEIDENKIKEKIEDIGFEVR